MCDPVSIGLMALTAVTSTVSVIAANQAADAQIEAIKNQQAQEAEQLREQASGDIFERDRAARREQARLRVAAGEAGLNLGGGSVEAMLMDSAMQATMARQRSVTNYENARAASEASANSSLSQIKRTSALGAGLQIGLSVANTAVGTPWGKAQIKKAAE